MCIRDRVRTPEEIKQERNERQAAWQLCTDRLKRLAEEETEAVSLLEKKYSKQIRVILEEQHLKEAERMQIPDVYKRQGYSTVGQGYQPLYLFKSRACIQSVGGFSLSTSRMGR